MAGVLEAPSSASMSSWWVVALYLGRYMSPGSHQWPSGSWAARMAFTGSDAMMDFRTFTTSGSSGSLPRMSRRAQYLTLGLEGSRSHGVGSAFSSLSQAIH